MAAVVTFNPLALRRSVMLGQKTGGGGLPAGYQQVAYIASTDNVGQYIDTLVPVTIDTDISVDCEFSFPAKRPYQGAFGAKGSTFSCVRYSSSDTFSFECGGGSHAGINYINGINTVTAIREGNTASITINGTQYDYTNQYNTRDGTLWLFGKESAGSAGVLDVKGACAIYYAKVYISGVLVRDMIPCYRKADNEPGMYDTVSGTFYTNAGSGDFIIPT